MDIDPTQLIGRKFATVPAYESTASVTYVDLATAGPSVTITINTAVWVTFGFENQRIAAVAGTGLMSMGASGANTIATGTYVWQLSSQSVAGVQGAFGQFPVTGLAAGSTTFYTQYRVSAGTFFFLRRHLEIVLTN